MDRETSVVLLVTAVLSVVWAVFIDRDSPPGQAVLILMFVLAIAGLVQHVRRHGFRPAPRARRDYARFRSEGRSERKGGG